MKYLKKFNEELRPDTYLRAANKLSSQHPERAKKLQDFAKPTERTWNFVVSGDYAGFVKNAKLAKNQHGHFWSFTGDDSQVYDAQRGYPNELKTKKYRQTIGSIHVSKHGLTWGGDNINGRCSVVGREVAKELKKYILDSCGIDIPINLLYTENPEYLNADVSDIEEYPKAKKRFWQR